MFPVQPVMLPRRMGLMYQNLFFTFFKDLRPQFWDDLIYIFPNGASSMASIELVSNGQPTNVYFFLKSDIDRK
jgi:hypothetical protein